MKTTLALQQAYNVTCCISVQAVVLANRWILRLSRARPAGPTSSCSAMNRCCGADAAILCGERPLHDAPTGVPQPPSASVTPPMPNCSGSDATRSGTIRRQENASPASPDSSRRKEPMAPAALTARKLLPIRTEPPQCHHIIPLPEVRLAQESPML